MIEWLVNGRKRLADGAIPISIKVYAENHAANLSNFLPKEGSYTPLFMY